MLPFGACYQLQYMRRFSPGLPLVKSDFLPQIRLLIDLNPLQCTYVALEEGYVVYMDERGFRRAY